MGRYSTKPQNRENLSFSFRYQPFPFNVQPLLRYIFRLFHLTWLSDNLLFFLELFQMLYLIKMLSVNQCACMLSHFSCVLLFVTPWTVSLQAPLSMGFSRQKYWSGLPCLPPGDLPDPGSNPLLLCLLHWQVGSLPLAPCGKPSNSNMRNKVILLHSSHYMIWRASGLWKKLPSRAVKSVVSAASRPEFSSWLFTAGPWTVIQLLCASASLW